MSDDVVINNFQINERLLSIYTVDLNKPKPSALDFLDTSVYKYYVANN